jgi:hypothetical protein
MDGEGLTPHETPPLPDLCAGEVLLTPIRVRADLAQSLRLIGTLPNGRSHSITYDLGTVQPDAENPVPRLLWAHRRIRHLLDTERTAQAIPLAIAHNLTCRGASFVAWDEAEKVPVAKREVYQPSLGIVESPLLPAAVRQPSFSGQVTDDSAEDTLQTCSAEQLSAEPDSMNLLNEDSDDRYSLSRIPSLQAASSLQFDFETTGPVLPRRVRQVFDTLRQAYGDLDATEDDTTVRLAGWTHHFGRLLIAKLAIPDAVGYLIAVVLRAWAMETTSTQRDQQLEAWLQDLALAPDFLTALRAELAAADPSQALKDSTALLEAAIAHPVGEVRS